MNEKIKNNCAELGYELYDITPERQNDVLHGIAFNLGYESMAYGTTYEDGTRGLLVRMKDDTYNNGVYMLHLTDKGEYVLEVIVPNTADKDELIQKLVHQMSTHFDTMDIADLGVFDLVEIYGYVIANTVVKRVAQGLYPHDKERRKKFVTLYMPRFLANVALFYSGDEGMKEEVVNSEPYVLKMMLDGDDILDLVPKDDVESEGGDNEE